MFTVIYLINRESLLDFFFFFIIIKKEKGIRENKDRKFFLVNRISVNKDVVSY